MRQWSAAYSFQEEYAVQSQIKHVLLYAGPCWLLWGLFLVAFYPGTMSPDSLDQWRQMTMFSFADYHPVFHTLLNWLVTRLWLSPAAVALAQILFLAIVFGFAMVQLEKVGVPLWGRGVLTALFALSPVNGMMTVTLWKDVPFSTAMLWLTAVLVAVVSSNGYWLRDTWHQVHLVVVLCFVVLLRHNGLLPALAVLAGLFAVYRDHWKRVAQVAAACLFVVFVIKGPFFSALHVLPTAPWQGMSIPIHQVGAMVNAGVSLEPEERALLEKILPMDKWQRGYAWNKYSVDWLVHNASFDKGMFDANSWSFFKLWLHLVVQHPSVALQDFGIQTSLLWQIDEPVGGYTFSTQKMIEPNDQGLASAHPFGTYEENVVQYVKATETRDWNWLFWRGGFWLYLALLIGLVCAMRFGREILLVFVPLLANTAGLFLTLPAQDARYVYPTLLIAPILCFLPLAEKRRVGWK